MTIVASYDWDTNTYTSHQPPASNGTAPQSDPIHTAWREAVAEVAARAKATLPDCAGRVDSAVKIVLAGDVELLTETQARVASQSNGTMKYFVVDSACTCPDYAKAPSGWCKHKIAAGLYRRALALGKTKVQAAFHSNGQAEASSPAPAVPATPPATPEPPAMTLPEAPVSITLKAALHGHEVLVTLRGTDFASVRVRVEAASQWLQAQGTLPPSAVAPVPSTPHCPQHGPMRPSTKGAGWYGPMKLADGTWCKGK